MGLPGTGLPPGHAPLGLEKIPGLFCNPSGTGRSGIVELIQPVLNFQVAPGEDSVPVPQQVSVLGIEGGSALGELLVDLAEEMGPFTGLLGSLPRGVDLVPVLPHSPHEEPQLVDELGGPRVPSPPGAGVGVVGLLVSPQKGGDPSHEKVLPV